MLERICCKILQEWLEGKGLQPVTWETLTKTFRDTGLSSLAEQIQIATLAIIKVQNGHILD